jgi:hypothetical protein
MVEVKPTVEFDELLYLAQDAQIKDAEREYGDIMSDPNSYQVTQIQDIRRNLLVSRDRLRSIVSHIPGAATAEGEDMESPAAYVGRVIESLNDVVKDLSSATDLLNER